MARESKRSRQRQERKVRAGGDAAPERPDRDEEREALDVERSQHDAELDAHPGSEHLSGEVDVADAQLSAGRPPLEDAAPLNVAPGDEVEGGSATEELFEHAFDGDENGGPDRDAGGAGGGDDDGGARPVARREPAQPEPSRRSGNRFANFLRGSWRELQRVQWPDRRQVVQATTVVIGFVLIAGGFLGLADWVAGKIVDFLV